MGFFNISKRRRLLGCLKKNTILDGESQYGQIFLKTNSVTHSLTVTLIMAAASEKKLQFRKEISVGQQKFFL